MRSAMKLLALLPLAFYGCGAGGEEPVDALSESPAENAGPPPWMQAALAQPRGLIRNDPGAAPGYVLFSQLSSGTTYLVDLEGRVVHSWTDEKASGSLYLQDDGTLYRLARIGEPSNFKAGGVAGYLQKFSWDGELLWEWKMGDDERMLHHDIEPLPNGNLLAIAWEQKSPEQARAAGRRDDLVPGQGIWSEWILEIEPLPPNDARIVWEWHVWDHLVQNHDPEAPHYGELADHPRRLDVNGDSEAIIDPEELEQLKALGYVPDDATEADIQSDFLHMNSIDYHPGLDQIVVSLPEIGELWFLDHSTTTEQARGSTGGRYGHGGDILYRWGNPRIYGRGTQADQQLFYQHEVLWIPEGFQNAGNLTTFNNGGGRLDGDWSSVVEIAPPGVDEGRYALPDEAPFGPAAPLWTYAPEPRASFYSPFISGAHRLPNGNTFICAGPQGRFLEVTPEGRIVWEYLNPYHGDVDAWMPSDSEQFVYASFRATKIPPDHPALAGRDLVPLDPQPEIYVPPPPAPEEEAGEER